MKRFEFEIVAAPQCDMRRGSGKENDERGLQMVALYSQELFSFFRFLNKFHLVKTVCHFGVDFFSSTSGDCSALTFPWGALQFS